MAGVVVPARGSSARDAGTEDECRGRATLGADVESLGRGAPVALVTGGYNGHSIPAVGLPAVTADLSQ